MNKLIECGCMPVVLPATTEPETLETIADTFDGFVFTGGGDIDGMWFGSETSPMAGTISPMRDAMEIPLARLLYQRGDKPVIGICRGMQVMAIAAGGNLYQDLASEYPKALVAHRQKMPHKYPSHEIHIAADSQLHHIICKDAVRVNSLHHQAVRDLPDDLVPSARTSDGVIEAFERIHSNALWLGIQWHPERLQDDGCASTALFKAFAAACRCSSRYYPCFS